LPSTSTPRHHSPGGIATSLAFRTPSQAGRAIAWIQTSCSPCFLQARRTPATGWWCWSCKGEHLSGNPDTAYKQTVLGWITTAFQADQVHRIGEMDGE
jgi:hypothetical protein